MKFNTYFGISAIKDLIVKKYNQDLLDIRQWWDEHDSGVRAWTTGRFQNGIIGTTTNDNAGTGVVGEYFSATTGAGAFPANNVYSDAASLSLTAGDWDVNSIVEFDTNGATVTLWTTGVSTTAGNSSTGLTAGDTVVSSGITVGVADVTLSLPGVRMSLSATTTVYQKYRATYSAGTPALRGYRMSARRIR